MRFIKRFLKRRRNKVFLKYRDLAAEKNRKVIYNFHFLKKINLSKKSRCIILFLFIYIFINLSGKTFYAITLESLFLTPKHL